MPEMLNAGASRWRVMVEDANAGWIEWCRWSDGKFSGPVSERDAEARAAQFRLAHPECAARVEETSEPAPLDFEEAFAPLLNPEGSGND